MKLNQKYSLLKDNIKDLKRIVVAFSGGVDSAFLLKTAYDVLGNDVLAVTARSSTYPQRELNEAIRFAKKYNIPHETIVSEELEIEGFSKNPLNRCYLCKQHLFSEIQEIANQREYYFIVEGSNQDDVGDYRPGLKAISELGIISPLKQVGLTKKDIRQLSKRINLETWNKPSYACLSSRFPYGDSITEEKLIMVDKAEQYILDLGFKQTRVRHHGEMARIEVEEKDFTKFLNAELRNLIYSKLKALGYIHVSLDLKGYRTGSMNEGIDKSS